MMRRSPRRYRPRENAEFEVERSHRDTYHHKRKDYDDRGSIQRDFEPREPRDDGNERGGKRRAVIMDRELSSSRREERVYSYSSHHRGAQEDSWRRSERDEHPERRRTDEENGSRYHDHIFLSDLIHMCGCQFEVPNSCLSGNYSLFEYLY